MTADLLFDLVNAAVLPAWLLLFALPGWRQTQRIAFGITVPVLSAAYAALLISLFATGEGFSPDAFGSLDGVMGLLGDRYAMVAGWAHYLAFDLFVGAWIVRDARAGDVPHLLILLPLALTFLAGPFGLLLYLILRQVRQRKLPAEPRPA